MPVALSDEIKKMASTDLFRRNASTKEFETGVFVGRPFSISYDYAALLVSDSWKLKAQGIPQGTFLLAYYENEHSVEEALLLRAIRPTKLPTDSDVISSMVEYYKDNLKTTGKSSQLDQFTEYEFSFSGLECRILGTFYKDVAGNTHFGADVENFYSSHNYSVVKPNADVLEKIVNFREGDIVGKPTDIRLGRVRYSSTRRFQASGDDVPVFVSPADFLGKRTALFGMTRTGKSNTVKKIIEATVSMSRLAKGELEKAKSKKAEDNLDPFTEDGVPQFPVGQIIFDINGEYANANLQDEGTAIFEIYKELVTRYSVIEKPGFKVLKVNFYNDVQAGFELIKNEVRIVETADYAKSFMSIDLEEPEAGTDFSTKTRFERVKAAYLCTLYKAGFKVPAGFTVKFQGNKEINDNVKKGGIDPSKPISLDDACIWFEWVWDNYEKVDFFKDYYESKGREWADEDLKAVLKFLTRKTKPGGSTGVSGFLKLKSLARLHTDAKDESFEKVIVGEIRKGKIVIVDLSQGDPDIQRLYSERICRQIFADSMRRFIDTSPNNFVQFYFEEAHNLFPRKEDKDLSQIYNRIAKEGAKMNLGLIYATQEVSSIGGNILKNTQNWFIAHLNNADETKEIEKYYDFGDFTEGLVRFSASDDKGFVRMKNYSNPYVVPVQIDRFTVKKGS